MIPEPIAVTMQVSERQWRDVSGSGKFSESLNQSYLTQQAQELGIVDLLNRLRQEHNFSQ